jgi:ribose 5-phosphate isomerase B
MRMDIAADHGGFELKVQLTAALKAAGYKVADLGAHELLRRNRHWAIHGNNLFTG